MAPSGTTGRHYTGQRLPVKAFSRTEHGALVPAADGTVTGSWDSDRAHLSGAAWLTAPALRPLDREMAASELRISGQAVSVRCARPGSTVHRTRPAVGATHPGHGPLA